MSDTEIGTSRPQRRADQQSGHQPDQQPDHQPDPRTRGAKVAWAEPHLAFLARRPVVQVVVVAVLLVAGSVVDAGLMRPAVMRVLGDSVAMSTFIAFVLAGLGAVAAGLAGWSWRGARGNHPGATGALGEPVTILAVWLALGLGITWLRIGAADAVVGVQYDGAAPVAGSHDPSETIAAALFLVVYVLVGVLAFWHLHGWRNDAFVAKTHAERDLARAETDLHREEALYERLRANVAVRAHDLTTAADELADVLASHRSLAGELEQLSRVEQAIGLGDPNKTGVTSAEHHANPYPARRTSGR